MDEIDIIKPEVSDKSAQIIIVQAICVALIILTVVVVKYFFKDTYADLKEWYSKNICVETSVSEVLESMDGGTDEV